MSQRHSAKCSLRNYGRCFWTISKSFHLDIPWRSLHQAIFLGIPQIITQGIPSDFAWSIVWGNLWAIPPDISQNIAWGIPLDVPRSTAWYFPRGIFQTIISSKKHSAEHSLRHAQSIARAIHPSPFPAVPCQFVPKLYTYINLDLYTLRQSDLLACIAIINLSSEFIICYSFTIIIMFIELSIYVV